MTGADGFLDDLDPEDEQEMEEYRSDDGELPEEIIEYELEEIAELHEKYWEEHTSPLIGHCYQDAMEVIGRGYSSDAIERACRGEGLKIGSGEFISALINNSYDDEFLLPGNGMKGLGYKNEKDVVVDGNVGTFAANRQRPGGRFEVRRDAGPNFANRQQGGVTIVKGNVVRADRRPGGEVGSNAAGGRIYLFGAGEISDDIGDDVEVYRTVEQEMVENEFREVGEDRVEVYSGEKTVLERVHPPRGDDDE